MTTTRKLSSKASRLLTRALAKYDQVRAHRKDLVGLEYDTCRLVHSFVEEAKSSSGLSFVEALEALAEAFGYRSITTVRSYYYIALLVQNSGLNPKQTLFTAAMEIGCRTARCPTGILRKICRYSNKGHSASAVSSEITKIKKQSGSWVSRVHQYPRERFTKDLKNMVKRYARANDIKGKLGVEVFDKDNLLVAEAKI